MSDKDAERQKMIYFDCYSGISGDMTLGALLDCGVRIEQLKEMLGKMNLPGYSLTAEKVSRGGIAGTRAIVHLDDCRPASRHLHDIIRLIEDAALPESVKKMSSAVFLRLAEAEAAVHGIPLEQVHFHEVGAVDAIIDIVGSAAALYLLEVDRISCSPLPVGRGEVQTAHGKLPLPAPATLQLLSSRQVPIYGHETTLELVTPTGAAIVTALAENFGLAPTINLETVGYGAGSMDPGYPNFLRVLIGTAVRNGFEYEEQVSVIETNIDDLNPEIYGFLMEKLLVNGALDVYFAPIQMKKNRPAVQLTVLAKPASTKQLQEIIFYETTTLGMRITTARKVMRPRETEVVQTAWGPIRIKLASPAGGDFPLHFAPEFEDCQAVATLSGLPLKEIYRLAEHLFRLLHRQ
ncbi:MAG TPA: nickel pincer cofactor biosynthesis protein LarC [Candidatus Limnocylindrales bacterium]|nr:nickel pincer cofactor biosynthesis protein LarC [Candidatus Limnocylindrales bacterium]